jgi:hypothetical protein
VAQPDVFQQRQQLRAITVTPPTANFQFSI